MRSLTLVEQGRFREAESEIGEAIRVSPEDPFPYSILARILVQRGRLKLAERAAREAIKLGPEDDLGYFELALVLLAGNRIREAEKAIREAIELDPEDGTNHAILARICFERRDWHDCLEAANAGLALDPEEETCQFYRGLALASLSRSGEAETQFESLLGDDPEDATHHAGLGWVLIRRGDFAQAQHHFTEATRLDPENEDAREGLVTCLRSRFKFFSWPLRFSFWLDRFRSWAMWVILLVMFVGLEASKLASIAYPQWKPVIVVVWILVWIVIGLSGIVYPFANVFLLMSRSGRIALPKRECVAAIWSVPFVLLGIWFFGRWILAGANNVPMGAFVTVNLIAPIYEASQTTNRWVRRAMLVYTVAMVLLALSGPLVLIGSFLFGSAEWLKSGIRVFVWLPLVALLGCLWADNMREWLEGRAPDEASEL